MIDIRERVKCTALHNKIISAEEAALFINPGDHVGVSGFSPAGYPKAVPLALAERMKKDQFKVDIWAGASVGDELDGALVRANGIGRRIPYQTNKDLRNALNCGKVNYADIHLSHMAEQVRGGFYGSCDVAIIEAVAITEEGHIVPSMSLGNSPTFVSEAKKIIVEINTTQPEALGKMHDVYEVEKPPFSKPIPIEKPTDRIGTNYIPCDTDKIVAIVPCDIPDKTDPVGEIDEDSKAMSAHIIKFLQAEIEKGRLPENLLPLQSGVGSVSNAVIAGLCESPFENLMIYSEVIQDGMLELLDTGKAKVASATALTLSPKALQEFYKKVEYYTDKIILRPQEISNNPAIIRQLGVIAINTAIEFDIFGNVNSTHILGTRMMNGIGGSGDYTRNAYISIFCTNSLAKKGKISSIVPMVSHTDHTEHDVDIFCTEQGIADVRGLAPYERAKLIINNCAHPNYRPHLLAYLEKAVKETNNAHTPMLLNEALSWHQRLKETGTMMPKKQIKGRNKRKKQKNKIKR